MNQRASCTVCGKLFEVGDPTFSFADGSEVTVSCLDTCLTAPERSPKHIKGLSLYLGPWGGK